MGNKTVTDYKYHILPCVVPMHRKLFNIIVKVFRKLANLMIYYVCVCVSMNKIKAAQDNGWA